MWDDLEKGTGLLRVWGSGSYPGVEVLDNSWRLWPKMPVGVGLLEAGGTVCRTRECAEERRFIRYGARYLVR
jgi:hypothetical protein